MDKVKIYGERNTGTNFVTRLIRRNFVCEIVPGTLAEAQPGYREFFEEQLEKTISDDCKRILARQIKLDQFFRGNVWKTLGWKHCIPPLDAISSYPDKGNILFVSVTKNPYAWVLSLFRRPYENVTLVKPDNLLNFINEPWLAGERDNTPMILRSPVELWNLKVEGYSRLGSVGTVVHARYEDVLESPMRFLDRIGDYLVQRRDKIHLPDESTKKDDVGEKDFNYYRDYYVEEHWRKHLENKHIATINSFLDAKVVRLAGYSIINSTND